MHRDLYILILLALTACATSPPVLHPLDPEPGVELSDLRERAQAGDAFSQYKYCNEMLKGGNSYYWNQQYERAYSYYHVAAEQSCTDAQVMAARMLDAGQGVERDEEEALRWMHKVNQPDPAIAAYMVATQGAENAPPANGIDYGPFEVRLRRERTWESRAIREKWLIRAAEMGHRQAQLDLGELYCTLPFHFSSDPVETGKCLTHGIPWYERAAEQGDPYAEYLLGAIWFTGRGFDPDYRQALRWFMRAQRHESNCHDSRIDESNTIILPCFECCHAKSFIGWMHEAGLGVAADPEEAGRWYRRSHGEGRASALYDIAQNFNGGWGSPCSLSTTIEWFEWASNAGSGEASFNLFHLFLEREEYPWEIEKRIADGVPARDNRVALRWLRKAADQGYWIAQGLLGQWYEEGYLVERDLEKAKYWLEMEERNR